MPSLLPSPPIYRTPFYIALLPYLYYYSLPLSFIFSTWHGRDGRTRSCWRCAGFTDPLTAFHAVGRGGKGGRAVAAFSTTCPPCHAPPACHRLPVPFSPSLPPLLPLHTTQWLMAYMTCNSGGSPHSYGAALPPTCDAMLAIGCGLLLPVYRWHLLLWTRHHAPRFSTSALGLGHYVKHSGNNISRFA